MPQKKKPHCISCGVLKTVENTSTKTDYNGTVGFHGRCKVCHSEHTAARYRKAYTLEELRKLHIKHLHRAERIFEEIQRRKADGQI